MPKGWREVSIFNGQRTLKNQYENHMQGCDKDGASQSNAHTYKDSPGGSVVKNPPANAGDTGDAGSIPGSEDPLEKEMATHSSILDWEISWTEEPRGLQFMWS